MDSWKQLLNSQLSVEKITEGNDHAPKNWLPFLLTAPIRPINLMLALQITVTYHTAFIILKVLIVRVVTREKSGVSVQQTHYGLQWMANNTTEEDHSSLLGITIMVGSPPFYTRDTTVQMFYFKIRIELRQTATFHGHLLYSYTWILSTTMSQACMT